MENQAEKPNEEKPIMSVGDVLKKAREAKGLSAENLCNTLRITLPILGALENGHYHELSGDPYIRALLGSVSRALGLEYNDVLKLYIEETGKALKAAEPSVPYTDLAQTHVTAHRKIFIAVVIVLLFALMFIIGKLNSGENNDPITPPPLGSISPNPDSLAQLADTSIPESKSLIPDSMDISASTDLTLPTRRDTNKIITHSTVTNSSNAAPLPSQGPQPVMTKPVTTTLPAWGNSSNAANTQSPLKSIDTSKFTSNPIKSLVASPKNDSAVHIAGTLRSSIESVWVQIQRPGRGEFGVMLYKGKDFVISHYDTIYVFAAKKNAITVTVEGKTMTPNRKRFKIYHRVIAD